MKRLAISISEEELKKGTEENGADGYEDLAGLSDCDCLFDLFHFLKFFLCWKDTLT